MIKKILYGFLGFLFSLILLALFAIKPAPTKKGIPYQQTDYYQTSIKNIQTSEVTSSNDTVKVGWAKGNITPSYPKRVVGYGFRKEFEIVLDSLFVRSMVFSASGKNYIYLSFDLLMIHPNIVEVVEEELNKKGISSNGIYYSATHTHTSFGGYGSGLLGFAILGGHDDNILNLIANQAVNAIETSLQTQEKCSLGYFEKDLPGLIENRVSHEAKVDAKFKGLKIQKASGKTALLTSFTGHATTLFGIDDPILSADYPGEMHRLLELNKSIDFSMYAAGAVGSHNPVTKRHYWGDKQKFAHDVSDSVLTVLDSVQLRPLTRISFFRTDVDLPTPLMRIDPNWALRPWAYSFVFGENHPFLTRLELNNFVFVGTPADFSGEIGLDLVNYANSKGKKLMINSFNGGYIGYVVPDDYYFKYRHRELYEINWYGPQTGSYFQELIEQIVIKK